MMRGISFNSGIIDGDDMREVLRVIPELENNFRQRKNYDEYYFDACTRTFTLDEINGLSREFIIELGFDNLIIKV